MTEATTTDRPASDETETTVEPDPTVTPPPAIDEPVAVSATGEEASGDPAVTSAPVDAVTDAEFSAPATRPGSPEVSPDGALLAYLLPNAEGVNRLWLSPTDGGDAIPVELPFTPIEDRDPDTGRLLRGPQWSPDGKAIALTGSHPDGNSLRTAVWLVPVPASASVAPVAAEDAASTTDQPAGEPEAIVATDDATTSDPAIAAAEAGETSDAPTPELHGEIEDAADIVTEVVVDPLAIDVQDAELADSAESVAVADEIDAEDVPAIVAEEIVTTSERVRLSRPQPLSDHATASDRSPRWSPDGMLIAFVRGLDGRDVIALASTDGEVPVAAELLTWSDSHDREPAWSRDGLFLAFTRKRFEDLEHADILVFVLATGEVRNLTSEKTSAIRHSLDWVPGRNLIAYVTRDNDWLSIAVINSDNKAGWTVTREAGDKTDPRFSPSEARLVYIRTEGFASVACERGLHASGAVAVDPGEGVAGYARWVADKRVVYGFSAPQRPFGFLVQDNLATADRTAVNVPGVSLTAGQHFRQPTPFEFAVGPEEQFSGLLYRTHGVAGSVPGIVYLPDGPLETRRGEFLPEEQALASTAMAVLTPVIHGATGFGAAVEHDLAELASSEIEISDIIEAGMALGKVSDIDERKLAAVGHGYGGTLALLSAGARPGVYAAVAAIDPITDWSIELEDAGAPWRNWVSRQYGMPLSARDRYALRTPETFAAVIDVPLLLVSTALSASRTAQFELFLAYLDEVGVSYERIDAPGEPIPSVLQRVARRLANLFLEGRDGAQVVEDLRADQT